jgi:hypothetical protein
MRGEVVIVFVRFLRASFTSINISTATASSSNQRRRQQLAAQQRSKPTTTSTECWLWIGCCIEV